MLDRVFRALASEPRREILRLVATQERTVTELGDRFDISLAAVSKHISVLQEAELVARTRDGRLHWCRFNPEALEPARASIEELRGFWNRRLDGLEDYLAAQSAARGKTARGRGRKGSAS